MARKTEDIVTALRAHAEVLDNLFGAGDVCDTMREAALRLEKSITISSDTVAEHWGLSCVEGAEWFRDAIADGSIDELGDEKLAAPAKSAISTYYLRDPEKRKYIIENCDFLNTSRNAKTLIESARNEPQPLPEDTCGALWVALSDPETLAAYIVHELDRIGFVVSTRPNRPERLLDYWVNHFPNDLCPNEEPGLGLRSKKYNEDWTIEQSRAILAKLMCVPKNAKDAANVIITGLK